MDKNETKKRAAPVSYRPPEELREEFTRRVENSGLNTSAFITKCIFSDDAGRRARKPPLEVKLLAKILAEAQQINARLDAPDALEHDELKSLLQDIRSALLKGMGRSP